MLQATTEKQSDPDSMSELLAASEMAIKLRLVHRAKFGNSERGTKQIKKIM